MAFRAYWKGYLRLSLVTIGVELYSAVSGTASPSFHQIHKPSGKRIRYQKVAPGIGPVDREEIVKGYELDKDEYVIVEPEELDEIKLESKRAPSNSCNSSNIAKSTRFITTSPIMWRPSRKRWRQKVLPLFAMRCATREKWDWGKWQCAGVTTWLPSNRPARGFCSKP